jgi:hypothetical protein
MELCAVTHGKTIFAIVLIVAPLIWLILTAVSQQVSPLPNIFSMLIAPLVWVILPAGPMIHTGIAAAARLHIYYDYLRHFTLNALNITIYVFARDDSRHLAIYS